jgi:hypothetical protein
MDEINFSRKQFCSALYLILKSSENGILSLILVKYRVSPVLKLKHVLLNYKHAVALVPGDPVQLESGDRKASFVPEQ